MFVFICYIHCFYRFISSYFAYAEKIVLMSVFLQAFIDTRLYFVGICVCLLFYALICAYVCTYVCVYEVGNICILNCIVYSFNFFSVFVFYFLFYVYFSFVFFFFFF